MCLKFVRLRTRLVLLALGRAGVVFFALPVVDGCRLGGDVCCADCMYIGVRDMRCLYKICS